MTWRTARSLDVLLAEVNAAAPGRSKASDGSIGDAAHASRSSDHNPWVTLGGVGIVRARDFTHDPAGGLDCADLAESVVALGKAGHPALGPGAYVIWRGRIASATYGWVWRTYSGSNAHNHHCHVSVATAAAGFDSTRPWLVATQEEDDMPFTEKQLRAMMREESREAVREEVDALLDAPVNVRQPGDKRFSKASVRSLLKDIAVAVKAVR